MKKLNKEEHEELIEYLQTLMKQAMKKRCSYDWFMESKYMKLVNDTFSDLLVIDAEEAGL